MAVVAFLVSLRGHDIHDFFSASAGVTVGVLIALALEARNERPSDDLQSILRFVGLATVLAGLVFSLTGLLLSTGATAAMALSFGLSWGGLVAGFVSLVLLVATGREMRRAARPPEISH